MVAGALQACTLNALTSIACRKGQLRHNVPTVKELIDRIMADADAIITERLSRFAAAA